MKKFHNILAKSKAPTIQFYTNHIQLKGGKLTITDGFSLIQYPIADILGPDIIEDDEEYFINAKNWMDSAGPKATQFEREGVELKVYHGTNCTGVIKLITKSEDTFYPDVEQVMPKDKGTPLLSVSTSVLRTLLESMTAESLTFCAHSSRNTISVHSNNKEDSRKVLIMPTTFSNHVKLLRLVEDKRLEV